MNRILSVMLRTTDKILFIPTQSGLLPETPNAGESGSQSIGESRSESVSML